MNHHSTFHKPEGQELQASSLRARPIAPGLVALLLFLAHPVSSGFRAQNPQGANPPAQAAGGVQAGEPKFRIIRSVSGTKGSQKGISYVVEDPRTVFYIPEDHQVIVYFEWEGPPGMHHLEGVWKNPEGKVVLLSDFDYQASQRRFGAYWALVLSEAVQPGLWALEAHVDGELAASHNFQIVASPRPAITTPQRRLLSPSEIYQRALGASVPISKRDASGEQLSEGSGFLIASGFVLTSFQNIDGAGSVVVRLADGRRIEPEGVVTWNRMQDWVILKMAASDAPTLPPANPNSVSVGDRCYTLDVSQEDTRVIVDGNVIGRRKLPQLGDRLSLSFGVAPRADGSPLLNEYGEYIGMVVRGSLLPGSASLDVVKWGYPTNIFRPGGSFSETLAVPVEAIPVPPGDVKPKALGELAEAGQFTPPLVGYRNIERGTLALYVKSNGSYPDAVNEKFEFSQHDREMAVLVVWAAAEKIKGEAVMHIFSLDNHALFSTKPFKINLGRGQKSASVWKVALAKVPPATYRLDVNLGTNPVWRTFFRVVE